MPEALLRTPAQDLPKNTVWPKAEPLNWQAEPLLESSEMGSGRIKKLLFAEPLAASADATAGEVPAFPKHFRFAMHLQGDTRGRIHSEQRRHGLIGQIPPGHPQGLPGGCRAFDESRRTAVRQDKLRGRSRSKPDPHPAAFKKSGPIFGDQIATLWKVEAQSMAAGTAARESGQISDPHCHGQGRPPRKGRKPTATGGFQKKQSLSWRARKRTRRFQKS